MDNDTAFKVYKLASSGFCCTQIMVKMALQEEENDNEDLVRAFRGMCNGINFMEKTCGVLTGGIGIIGLYAGKGNEEEDCKEDFTEMMDEYTNWFQREFKSTDCRDLAGIQNIKDVGKKVGYPVKCGEILQKSYMKIQYILDEHNYEFGDRG
ncbi:DVU_1555 family C-GCAxxG-C-C protein [Clostridium sp. JNZ X4-2]